MTNQTDTARTGVLSDLVGAWRALGRSGQFTFYMRVSLQVVVLVVVVMANIGLWQNPLLFPAHLAILIGIGIWSLVLGGFALVVLDRVPALRVGEAKFPRRAFSVGLGLTAATWIAGMALLPAPGDLPQFGFLAVAVAQVIASMAYVFFLRHRWAIALAAGMISFLACGFAIGDWLTALLLGALLPLFGITTVGTTLWCVRLMREADQAAKLQQSLTVTQERLRFAQELHDTLGQHLAAMSVKSELALALARRKDPRVETELEELQRLTRASTTELREVVDGYRTVNLATEIAGARRLLETANVEVTISGDAFDVPEQHRELAGWFVREASTNVLKHADATAVELAVTGTSISMRNDGAHPSSGRSGGLEALRRRAAGGHVLVERDGAVFTVTLTF